MLGFLSTEKDAHSKVTSKNIAFVHIPNGASNEEIKVLISQKARLFADTLNLNEVFLHFGKETIIYDYSI